MVYIFLLFIVAEVNCLESRLLPDISLNGMSFTNDNLTVFQFICSTNIAVWQCTAEFLIEERTHTDIRYENNTCYHTDGICSPKLCACSESCKSFTWNVIVINDMQNHLYSCVARLVTGGVNHLANVTVKWDNNNGFQLFKKIIVPINIVSQQPTTPTQESSTDFTKYVDLIIISTTVGSITCISVFIALAITCRKNCYTKQNKAPRDNMNDISTVQLPDRSNNPAPNDYTSSFSYSNLPFRKHTSASQGRRSVRSNNKIRGQNPPKASQGRRSMRSNDTIRRQNHPKASQGRQNVQSTNFIREHYHTQASQGRRNEYSNGNFLEERHTQESKGRGVVHFNDYFREQSHTRGTRDSRNPNSYDNIYQQKHTPDHLLRQTKRDSNDCHQSKKNPTSKTSKSHTPMQYSLLSDTKSKTSKSHIPSNYSSQSDPKFKTSTLHIPLCYSPLSGHTSSNSTQSSGTEEGKQTVSNTYNINLNNRIVLQGQNLQESSV